MKMAARTKRYFDDRDKNQLITELRNWRSICVSVCTKAPIHGNAYKAADKLISDIDIAVEALTGNREYFYNKPHSTR
jgi:hypothetical protein